jgi:chromosome segregation and condensation protein ScpB
MLKETVLADFSVSRDKNQSHIGRVAAGYQGKGVQLVKVAGGYRLNLGSPGIDFTACSGKKHLSGQQ